MVDESPVDEPVDGLDPELLAVFQNKLRQQREEIARIANDEDVTREELAAFTEISAEPTPEEIARAQRGLRAMMNSHVLFADLTPVAIRTEGDRALFLYQHAEAGADSVTVGVISFERAGDDWRQVLHSMTSTAVPEGASVDEIAAQTLEDAEFNIFYNPHELLNLPLEADSLAASLQLRFRSHSVSRQCRIVVNGREVISAGSAQFQGVLLLGREFGSSHSLSESPLRNYFSLEVGRNSIGLSCDGGDSAPAELHLTRHGEKMPSVVVVLNDASGSEASGSFDLSASPRPEPEVPTLITNAPENTSGVVIVRETQGVTATARVEGEGGGDESWLGAPINLSLSGLVPGRHDGSVTLQGVNEDTDSNVQVAVVLPGVSRAWLVPIEGRAERTLSFEVQVPSPGAADAPAATAPRR